jgi:hypothetical protein
LADKQFGPIYLEQSAGDKRQPTRVWINRLNVKDITRGLVKTSHPVKKREHFVTPPDSYFAALHIKDTPRVMGGFGALACNSMCPDPEEGDALRDVARVTV